MQRSKIKLYLGLGLFFFGLIFSAVGFLIPYGGETLGGQTSTTQGVVTGYDSYTSDGTRMYKPIIEYRPNGASVLTNTSSIATSWQAYEVGEAVEVQFDPDDPTHASIRGGGMLFFYIFGGVGLVIMAAGAAVLLRWQKRRAEVNQLQESGRRISATIVDFYQDGRVAVNRRHPWVVVAEGTVGQSGKRQQFLSEYLWQDPTGQLSVSDEVTVLVSPGNSKVYFVELVKL